MPPFDLQPTLENEVIILRPLRREDFDDLYAVASDPLIWEQHPSKERSQREGFTRFFDEAMSTKAAFAIIDKKTNAIIGSTRYHVVSETVDAIEIGWTFLARNYWGGSYNRALKTLQISHAFKHVPHILFYIHESNFRSQKAVEKIGGVRVSSIEGKALNPRANASVIYRISR